MSSATQDQAITLLIPILARYMQILEPFVTNAYPYRIINIHRRYV